MTWKTREDIAAGAYQQRANTVASSFTGLNASSQTTLRDEMVTQTASLARTSVASDFRGNATIRGFATMNSGTTVVSISATGVVSGDVILTSIIQYASVQTLPGTIGMIPVTCARSVRANAFEIVTVASYAPLGDMPVCWWRVQ